MTIDLNAYIGIHSLILEETIRLNHIECTDTRRRLYITKKAAVILGYCHNCGESGIISSPSFYAGITPLISAPLVSSIPMPSSGVNPEEDLYIPPLNWEHAKLYEYAGIQYDPVSARYNIPVSGSREINTGVVFDYVGYISRRKYPEQQPKYLAYLPKTFRGWSSYYIAGAKIPGIVLVEDVLSACAVAGVGYIGVCLFGAKHSIEKVHEISNAFDKPFYVWYDNDNEYVNEASRVTSEYLTLLGNKVSRIITPVDPKNLSPMSLLQVLNDNK